MVKGRRVPGIANWILKRTISEAIRYSAIGDFDEIYRELAESRGAAYARFWYWKQTLKSLPPFFLDSSIWRLVMFRNFLKISMRNITKHKVHSAINVLGLALGLACCFLIFLWVTDELSYDRFHVNLDRLYRMVLEYPKSTESAFTAYAAPAAAEWLRNNIPEIQETARFRIVSNRPQILVAHNDKQFYEERFGFGDKELFELFTFPFLEGEPEQALSNPDSIVLSEDTAHRYFGRDNPIGKVLNVENQFDFIVTGIMKNIPDNSHLKFDMLVPFENIESFMPEYGEFLERHNLHFFRTYVMAHRNASIPDLEEKVREYLSIMFNRDNEPDYSWRHHLQPVKEIHLRTRGMKDLAKRGDIRYVYVFSLTGILILLIACINFMNLSTARSSMRAREVGMRKVVGARRFTLVGQFFCESVLSSLIALLIAVAIVFISLATFNALTGKNMSLGFADNMLTFAFFFLIAVFTGILAGSYPAVYLSSFNPVKALKGTLGVEKGKGFLRRVLVVAQFAIAIGLISCTMIVYNQHRFMKNINLGFEKEHIVYLKLNGNLRERFNAVKAELLKERNIVNVSASSRNLTSGTDYTGAFSWEIEGKSDGAEMDFNHTFVDRDFIETFQMELVQGRSFSKDESKKPGSELIINQSAARTMNVESPIGLSAGEDERGIIVGVVKDYHFQSLYNVIRPLVLRIDPTALQFMHVRIRPDNIPATLSRIESVCRTFEPRMPFDYRFLDEAFDLLYRSEERMGKIFTGFAVFAVFIACLGIFGLSLFVAESRIKEIGIRKVLGASMASLIELMSREFLVLVCLANVIAWPVAYCLTSKWLQNFAYRAGMSLSPFILTGALVFVISLVTVSYQSIKAAAANPVDSLRYE